MRFFAFLIFFLWTCQLSSQVYQLNIVAPDKGKDFVIEELGYHPLKLDSVQVDEVLYGHIGKLQDDGYVEAGLDSLIWHDSTAIALLHIGSKYQWRYLSQGNAPDEILNGINFSSENFHQKTFSTKKIEALKERLLTYAEDNGYPFARIGLDSFIIEGTVVDAQLKVEMGPFIVIENIKLEGDSPPVKPDFLRQYLEIEPGMPYNRSNFMAIIAKIEALPYLTLRKEPFITFFGHSAMIHLDVATKNASRFDFLIGVLPISGSENTKRKALLTGSFDMEMVNQLKRGEVLAIQIEQLRLLSPRMKLAIDFPYIFKLPIGVDANFSLYKRDTNYIDVRYEVGVKYLLNGRTSFRAFVNRQSSALITVDTQLIKSTQRLPDTLDVSRNFYGLAFQKEILDYRLNPSKGWVMGVKVGVGTRKITVNNQIQSIGFQGLYDELKLHSFQYKMEADIAAYFSLFPSFVLKTSVQGGWILNKEPILANEQYRIGGNRLLRGFDEESVFATNYVLGTLEFRLLLDRNSNLYLFGDLARVDERTKANLPEDHTIDQALGFGAGVTFATKVGLFNISLAYGTRKGNAIDFGAPKVHMGFVGQF